MVYDAKTEQASVNRSSSRPNSTGFRDSKKIHQQPSSLAPPFHPVS